MHKLKSHKSVEKIAKKHRLDVSFVQNQLKMGVSIEKEHTKDKDLATDIALQHLDEIPDYYTRLKKMEASAKKEHKKFKDVKEHCGCEEDDAVEDLESELKKLKNTSYSSIDKLMRRIMKKYDVTAKNLHNAFVSKNRKTPDDWVEDLKEGTLHHWFKGSKSKEGKPGWVQADGSPCANEPGETKTPKCFSSARLRELKRKGKQGEAIIKSAIRRKRQEDKSQQQKTGGAKPTLVSTFAKGKKDPNYVKAEPGIKEAMELNEAQKDRPGKGSGKKDACYNKVKSRYDVWPSAYASGALVKCRKVGASNWGTKSEETQMIRYCPKCKKDETRSECRYGPKYWDMFSLPSKLSDVVMSNPHYHANSPHPGNIPEERDHEHSMARSEISTIISAAKRLRKKMKGEGNIKAWVQSKITKAADYLDSAADYVDSGEMNEQMLPSIAYYEPRGEVIREKCWKGYKQIGMKRKENKVVPNCVKEQFSNWRGELFEDWQSVNRKDKTDGLSPAAVKAYRRENPGSKLQTAVTEKSPKGKRAKRRKSFCSRSAGQRDMHNIDCSKTPDKPICKARKRWKC